MRGLHKVQRSYYGGKMRGGMVSSPAAGPVGYSWMVEIFQAGLELKHLKV